MCLHHFCKYCWQCFSNESVLVEHKGTCLKINGKQTVKLRNGSIKFKNHFKQLAVPFTIYADFECNVNRVRASDRNNNTTYTEKYQVHILCSFAYEFVCVDDRFSKPVVFYRGNNAVYWFIETNLREYDYCKKVIKSIFIRIKLCLKKMSKYFSQVISAGCDKLFDVGENKARDHCHITRKNRSCAHWSYNINLKLPKNFLYYFITLWIITVTYLSSK